MSLPKQEIWGAPSTWIYSLRQYGLETTAAKLGNFDKPKTAYFGEGATSGFEGSLTRAINVSHKLTANEFLDESICPCGQDPQVSPWGKIAIFNKNNNGSAVPEIQDFTDENINWFFADKPTSVPLFQRQIIRQHNNFIHNEQYAPNATTPINANNNIPVNLCPYVSWGLKSLVLSIEVGITANDANPISGEISWVTLDDWKNNYSTTHYMTGLRFFVRSCVAVNNTTLALTYNDDGTLPAGNGCSGLICILNKIKVKNPTADTPTQFLHFMGYQGTTRRAHIFTPTSQIIVDSSTANAPTLGVFPCWNYFENQTIQVYHPYSDSYNYYYKIPYSDDTYNKVMAIAALFGCFFTPTNKYVFDYDMLDNDLYLPIIDKNGVAHGQYTKGAANATNSLYTKNSIRDIDYDPTKPPSPPPPTPSGDPMLPEGLYFTMAGRGTGIWALTPSEIDQAWNDIFGSDVDVKMFGNNPMNAILSLKWTPFDWTQTGIQNEGPIVLGDQTVNILHSYPMIQTTSDAEKHGYGTIKFNYDKSFYNARYMQARLFLPFYGYYELPAAQLLSSELRIDFYYNVPDELGVYIISYDNVIYDYVECSVDLDVPLTGSNAAAINESKRSQALSIASQVAATAATSIIGASTIAGFTSAGRFLAQGIDIIAADTGVGLADVGFETEAYFGTKGAGRAFSGSQTIGIGAGIAGAAASIANTVRNGKIERAALRTNLPYHGSALQTTFLHMSMKPYVQIFKNAIMEGLDRSNNGVDQTLSGETETQYKLKVGHACNVWKTLIQMPENSLLQTTGVADMSSMGMELEEFQEFNSILQTGFYR